jgi:hypothetical protein
MAFRAVEESRPKELNAKNTALRDALRQLLHAPSLEEGIVGTVTRGGNTDTDAAIAGALLAGAMALMPHRGTDAGPLFWTASRKRCPGRHAPGRDVYGRWMRWNWRSDCLRPRNLVNARNLAPWGLTMLEPSFTGSIGM